MLAIVTRSPGTPCGIPVRVGRAMLVFGACAVLHAAPAGAQRVDSVRVAPPAPAEVVAQAVPDSLRPPISARRAFLYSFLVPGWGQSKLERPVAGAIFATLEASAIALLAKTTRDLHLARRHVADSIIAGYELNADGTIQRDADGNAVARYAPNRYAQERVDARQQHVEDYIALIVANHLFAGLEAFVAAQLWDLPAHVDIRATPQRGGAGVSASFKW